MSRRILAMQNQEELTQEVITLVNPELDALKADAAVLEVEVSEDDTFETLSAKIAQKKDEQLAALNTLKEQAVALEVEVSEDDTFETLSVKVAEKLGSQEGNLG